MVLEISGSHSLGGDFMTLRAPYRLTIWSLLLPSIKNFWLKSHLYRDSLPYQLEVERGAFWSIYVI